MVLCYGEFDVFLVCCVWGLCCVCVVWFVVWCGRRVVCLLCLCFRFGEFCFPVRVALLVLFRVCDVVSVVGLFGFFGLVCGF